jgi:hypothetical protein
MHWLTKATSRYKQVLWTMTNTVYHHIDINNNTINKVSRSFVQNMSLNE